MGGLAVWGEGVSGCREFLEPVGFADEATLHDMVASRAVSSVAAWCSWRSASSLWRD